MNEPTPGAAIVWAAGDSVNWLDGTETLPLEWFVPYECSNWRIVISPDDEADLLAGEQIECHPDAEHELFVSDRARARQELEDAELRVFRADLEEL